VLATNIEDNLNSDIKPVSALEDVKEGVSSVPLQCPDVKVEVMVRCIILCLFEGVGACKFFQILIFEVWGMQFIWYRSTNCGDSHEKWT
jgi:hypothetical protein